MNNVKKDRFFYSPWIIHLLLKNTRIIKRLVSGLLFKPATLSRFIAKAIDDF